MPSALHFSHKQGGHCINGKGSCHSMSSATATYSLDTEHLPSYEMGRITPTCGFSLILLICSMFFAISSVLLISISNLVVSYCQIRYTNLNLLFHEAQWDHDDLIVLHGPKDWGDPFTIDMKPVTAMFSSKVQIQSDLCAVTTVDVPLD